MNNGHVWPNRRYDGKPFAGEWTCDAAYVAIYCRKIYALVAAKYCERQMGGAGVISVRHCRVRVLLEHERIGPAVLYRIAKTMQRADSGISAPREDQPIGS